MNETPSRLESIFHAALERPAAERASFIDQACGGDASLHSQVVKLLRAHEAAGDLLDPKLTRLMAVIPEERSGELIGRYKLLQKIGEGGCGVVWMADQEEPVRRRVALKIIKLGMDTKQVIARFEAERQALAMMDHSNIAKVLEAGATETGRPYFVMELVRGLPITKFCDEKQLKPSERLELFGKVCHAVQHAHQKGIIHRDLKPSNILVTINDGVPVPKVIDFGIAKATQGRLTDSTLFTAFEQFIGTPAYMSPEQTDLSSVDIDTRSDVYSLGVLLYELLTGRTPFDPKTLARAGIDEIRRKIRETEAPRPSRWGDTLNDDERGAVANQRGILPAQLSILLRGDLDWIVMRCLEKDRSRRYDTANGLAMDIQRHLRSEPVIARPPSAAYVFQKLVRRHRVAAMGVAAVAVTLTLGLIASLTFAYRADLSQRDAKRDRNAAQAASVLADAARKGEAASRVRAEEGERKSQEAVAVLSRTTYAAEMKSAKQAIADSDLRGADLLLRKYPETSQDDWRGWEYRYLWEQAHPDASKVIGSYLGPLGGVAISPDGMFVASVARPTIEIRSATTLELIKVLGSADERAGGMLRFSPDGRWLASGLAAPPLRIRDTRTWELAAFLNVSAPFAFVHGGKEIVVREDDHLSLWSTETWLKLSDLPGQVPRGLGGRIQSIAVSPDGKIVFYAAGGYGGIRSWDLEAGVELSPMEPPFADSNWAISLDVSRDGLLAAAHPSGKISVWDTRSHQMVHVYEGISPWATTVAFSPSGNFLAAASLDQTIVFLDVRSHAVVHRLAGHLGQIIALAVAPNGQWLVSGSVADGTVRRWNWPEDQFDREHPKGMRPMAFLDSGPSLLVLSQNAGFSRYNLATGSHETVDFKRPPISFDSRAGSMMVSPDLSTIAQIGAGGVEISDLKTGAKLKEIRLTNGPVEKATFSSDGRQFAVSGGLVNGEVWLWNTRDWSSQQLPVPSEAGRGRRGARGGVQPSAARTGPIAFSSDGKHLGVVAPPFVLVYDLANLGEPLELSGAGNASSLALSPDGTKLAVGTLGPRAADPVDATIPGGCYVQIWDLQSPANPVRLGTHMAGVLAMAFSPDGRTLASCGDDFQVKLWNLDLPDLHSEILTLRSLPTKSFWARFSPDGEWLVVGSADEQLQVWHAPSFAEIEKRRRVVEVPAATGTQAE